MFKKIFFHSIIAGILASVDGIIYNRIYFFATETDFSRVLNNGSIIALDIMVCLAAGMIYWVLLKLLKKKGEAVFSFLFSIISFACIMIPISITLPLKVQSPELFPALPYQWYFSPRWHGIP
ncbi:MAG: hypothetical protein ABI863_09760 [Ginsengibacter sp.]